MREIKFRAWDKKKNIYGLVLSLEYPVSETDTMFLGHPGKVQLYNPKNVQDCGFWGSWIEKVIIEQFTGLHDKNGKEIYFLSDIVEATVISEYDGSETKISGFLFVDMKRFKISMHGYEDFNLMFADELEIIGNIHENPEILK